MAAGSELSPGDGLHPGPALDPLHVGAGGLQEAVADPGVLERLPAHLLQATLVTPATDNPVFILRKCSTLPKAIYHPAFHYCKLPAVVAWSYEEEASLREL